MSFKKLLKVALAALMVISLAACDTKPKEKTATFDEAGTFDSEEVLTSADITADDVIIQNKTIEQDLYIKVPGNGSVTLDNVTVKGSIYVQPAEDDSTAFLGIFEVVNAANAEEYPIYLFDVVSNSIEVEDVPVRLVASGDTNINMVKTDSDITLQEQSINKNGFNDVTIEDGSEVEVTLLATGIRQLTVNDTAMTTILTDSATLIEMLEANSPVGVHGGATINLLQANAPVMTDNEPGSVVLGENGSLNGDVKEEVTTTTTPVTTTTKPVTTTKKPVTTTKKPVTTTTPKPTTPVTTTVNTKANTAAVITAEDVTILIDSTFNPLKGVTIYDAEDGNVTVTSAHIKSNNVNVAKRGTYTVTYVYVDKGGLTTTLNRKVTVSNELEKPTNLKVELDAEGYIVMSWDAVDNAYTYDIYVGSTLIDYTKKTTYVLDPEESLQTDELEEIVADLYNRNDSGFGKSFKVGVSAVHKYDDEVRDSDIAKETFYYDDEEFDAPETIKGASKTPVSFNYKISPVGINSKKATAEVTVYCNDNPLVNEYITDTVRTNKYGKAEFDYDVNKGIEFEMVFDEVGTYDFNIVISDDSHSRIYPADDDIPYEFEIEVVKVGSSSKRGTTKPELISWTGDDTWGANSGAELRFSLTEDFDITEGESEIEVHVYAWSKEYTDDDWVYFDDEGNELPAKTYGPSEDEYVLWDDEVLDADYVDADEEIVIYLDSSIKSLREITQDYKDGCKIYMYAEITVKDYEGTIKSIKTKNITFEK